MLLLKTQPRGSTRLRRQKLLGGLSLVLLVLGTLFSGQEPAAAIPSVALPNGGRMQQLAFGLYNVPRENVRTVVNAALKVGCRNFDFASFYNNEAECGAALKSWLAKGHDRSELFITTKVWTTDMGSPADALRSAENSITELGLGPVDLLMVHWPMPGKHVAAYVALEALVRAGKAKSLGISNYSPADYEELLRTATLQPQVNTFENNPMLYRKEWVDFFQSKGVVVMAYKPMQRAGPVLTCDTVASIASRTSKTPAQVCLRWNIQKVRCLPEPAVLQPGLHGRATRRVCDGSAKYSQGNVVTFKSNSPARIAENVDVFEFELSQEDMAGLDALTTEAVKAEALAHWRERRSGTPAPWGDGLRPEPRLAMA